MSENAWDCHRSADRFAITFVVFGAVLIRQTIIFLAKPYELCYTDYDDYMPKRHRKGIFMSKFVIRTVASGVKFDLKAGNGQSILTSEVYTTEAACRKGIESVAKNAPIANVENQTEEGWETLTHPKFEMYQDKAGEYRFRLKARNGEIIAVSEGYTAKAGCLNGIESVRKNAGEAEIVEE